ncbi:MAG: hypothetical protein C5B49_08040 [Bdellovibrio sp.]|nr:MAG: hypothetical protein C5B49_08040 [Bdellovibrio sp.]
MSIWSLYDWERVKPVLPSEADIETGDITVAPHKPSGVKGLVSLLLRRSARGFTQRALGAGLLSDLLSQLQKSADFPWLSVRICVQRAEDVSPGIYLWQEGYFRGVRQGVFDVGPIVQKQWWVNGGGISLFLCVDWKAASLDLSGSQGYHSVWLILGQICQHLVQWSCEHDLGTRMTPAISESLAREILGIEEKTQDAAYFLRIGYAIPEQPS